MDGRGEEAKPEAKVLAQCLGESDWLMRVMLRGFFLLMDATKKVACLGGDVSGMVQATLERVELREGASLVRYYCLDVSGPCRILVLR